MVFLVNRILHLYRNGRVRFVPALACKAREVLSTELYRMQICVLLIRLSIMHTTLVIKPVYRNRFPESFRSFINKISHPLIGQIHYFTDLLVGHAAVYAQ